MVATARQRGLKRRPAFILTSIDYKAEEEEEDVFGLKIHTPNITRTPTPVGTVKGPPPLADLAMNPHPKVQPRRPSWPDAVSTPDKIEVTTTTEITPQRQCNLPEYVHEAYERHCFELAQEPGWRTTLRSGLRNLWG
jgi:hypothetical protein